MLFGLVRGRRFVLLFPLLQGGLLDVLRRGFGLGELLLLLGQILLAVGERTRLQWSAGT